MEIIVFNLIFELLFNQKILIMNDVTYNVVERNLSEMAETVVGEVVERNLSEMAETVVGEVVEYNSLSEFYGEVPFVPSARFGR